MLATFRVGVLLLTVFINFRIADARHGSVKDREMLWHTLSRYYMKDIAPDGADGGPVTVHHSVDIVDIVSWENDILSLHLYEMMTWNDPRLQWVPEMFNGVTELKIPNKMFWVPDILLFNSVDEYHSLVPGDLNGIINYGGNVTLVPPRITNTLCTSIKDLYPEEQASECTLKYGSWTRSGLDLDLQAQGATVDMYSHNSYLEVKNVTTKRNVRKYKCCPETYIDITYTLTI